MLLSCCCCFCQQRGYKCYCPVVSANNGVTNVTVLLFLPTTGLQMLLSCCFCQQRGYKCYCPAVVVSANKGASNVTDLSNFSCSKYTPSYSIHPIPFPHHSRLAHISLAFPSQMHTMYTVWLKKNKSFGQISDWLKKKKKKEKKKEKKSETHFETDAISEIETLETDLGWNFQL